TANDAARTTDRAGRAVERGEKAVSCGVDLATAIARELAANHSVVSLEQIEPRAIAKAGCSFRGADDVREEHRGEHSVRLDILPTAGLPHVSQKSPDFLVDLPGRLPDREMSGAGNFDELSPRDPLGDVSSGLERHDSVLGALQHERRYPHSAQDVPDVDLLVHS